jgi:hypothetical protein
MKLTELNDEADRYEDDIEFILSEVRFMEMSAASMAQMKQPILEEFEAVQAQAESDIQQYTTTLQTLRQELSTEEVEKAK